MNVTNILTWIVLGLVAGLLARFLLPGRDPYGPVATIAIGIIGAFLGGFIAVQLKWGAVDGFNIHSIGVAVGGAILLLLGLRMLK